MTPVHERKSTYIEFALLRDESTVAPAMTAMAREMAEQPEVIGALLDRREEFTARLRAIAPDLLTGVILIARVSSDNAAIYGRYVLEAALRRPVSLAAPSLWTR